MGNALIEPCKNISILKAKQILMPISVHLRLNPMKNGNKYHNFKLHGIDTRTGLSAEPFEIVYISVYQLKIIVYWVRLQ